MIGGGEVNEVLNLLKVEQLDIEQISEALKKDISETKKEVLDLEINGQICLNVDGKYNIKLL